MNETPFQQEVAATIALRGILRAAKTSPRGAAAGAAAYIEEHGAGVPEVDFWAKDCPRENAKYWASIANQTELEAFLVAAVMEMERSPILVRAAKRLAALGFQNMDAVDRAAFLAWAGKQ